MSSFFSQSKGERDMKIGKTDNLDTRFDTATTAKSAPQAVSTIGADMLITGNIVCAGAVNVLGRVIGDIHAAELTISEGAKVEGKIDATEAIIQGTFNGTVHGNNVKLTRTAMVEGEIYNRSLTIETDAQFEGTARRLVQAVTAPTAAQAKGENVAAPLATAPAMDMTTNGQAPMQTYNPAYSQ
jgi:cytoskeletal protein CcmA (bactofilin family)